MANYVPGMQYVDKDDAACEERRKTPPESYYDVQGYYDMSHLLNDAKRKETRKVS